MWLSKPKYVLQMHTGPDVGGEHGPYRQSERKEIYQEHVDRCGLCPQDFFFFHLLAAKRLVVACASGKASLGCCCYSERG